MKTLADMDILAPWLTVDIPGVGGVIKRVDDDFHVEEIPLYEPSKVGTHCYFDVEKRGLTTHSAIRLIAAALGRNPRDIGYAGLKDAHGVTRQRFSIEHVDPERLSTLEWSQMRVLSVSRHTNKIKLGHLRGNRFKIRIRKVRESDLGAAQQVLDVLTARGVPNFFGPQRFGVRGDNAAIGRAALFGNLTEAVGLILGRPGEMDQPSIRRARELFDKGNWSEAEKAWPSAMTGPRRMLRALVRSSGDMKLAWRAVDHSLRKLFVSAFQSGLFNTVLTKRLVQFDRMLDGDVAWKHCNGACFLVEDAAVEQPRCIAFEISPTGPLFGRRMKEPAGEPARIEEMVLGEAEMQREQLRIKDGSKLDGARRPLRVPLVDAAASMGKDEQGRYLEVAFMLPPGSYATCVVREICKHGRETEESKVQGRRSKVRREDP